MLRIIIVLVIGFWQVLAYAENTTYVDIDRISIGRSSGAVEINTSSNLMASTSACKLIKRVKIPRGDTQTSRESVQKQYALILLAKSLDKQIRFSGSCDVGNATFLATYITMK